MAGFSFVTGAVSNDLGYTTTSYGSGNLQVALTFNILFSGTNAADTSSYRLAYGTGTAPACDGASTGTGVGNQFTLGASSKGATSLTTESEVVSLAGLNPGTTYWFDLQTTTNDGNTWTYSNPQISVVELP